MKKPNKKVMSIRESVGLPDSNGEIVGAVTKSLYEVNENTISYAPPGAKNGYKALNNNPDSENPIEILKNGIKFDYGASGGATSANTGVNADGNFTHDESSTK